MRNLVNWRDIERDLLDMAAIQNGVSVEYVARELAWRINERHWRAAEKQFALVQEYQQLRREKFKNNAR